MQLAHRLREILHLWQDEILERRSVADESVGRRHPLHWGVEPCEALVRDLRGDLGAIAPGQSILVGHEHPARLLQRRGDRSEVHWREAAQIDHLAAHTVLLLERHRSVASSLRSWW